ncbi:MAG: hypothetical protein OJF49_002789 [Ktedonobacterales bacterium]|nr:MAG: hypothetical protein OJF49_002789 [Ktedonobacterales bacterium]
MNTNDSITNSPAPRQAPRDPARTPWFTRVVRQAVSVAAFTAFLAVAQFLPASAAAPAGHSAISPAHATMATIHRDGECGGLLTTC